MSRATPKHNPNMFGQHRRRVKNPLPQEYIDQVRETCVYLINITEQQYWIQRTYQTFTVPGCKEGEKFTSTKIIGRIQLTDQGEDNSSQTIIPADDIAQDLLQDINANIVIESEEPSFLGVFGSDTATPRMADIAEANERLDKFNMALVAQADRFWDDPKAHKEINALHRRSARRLNLKRDWLYEVQQLISCPACGESLKAGVAVCKTCFCVIDDDKARKHKMGPYAPNYQQPVAAKA